MVLDEAYNSEPHNGFLLERKEPKSSYSTFRFLILFEDCEGEVERMARMESCCRSRALQESQGKTCHQSAPERQEENHFASP